MQSTNRRDLSVSRGLVTCPGLTARRLMRRSPISQRNTAPFTLSNWAAWKRFSYPIRLSSGKRSIGTFLPAELLSTSPMASWKDRVCFHSWPIQTNYSRHNHTLLCISRIDLYRGWNMARAPAFHRQCYETAGHGRPWSTISHGDSHHWAGLGICSGASFFPSKFLVIECISWYKSIFFKSFEGSSGQVDFVPALRHCIGNMVNGVVFGRTYEMNDPIWIYLQHLLDEGIKAVAVAGPLNFLPILRSTFPKKNLIIIIRWRQRAVFILLAMTFFWLYLTWAFWRLALKHFGHDLTRLTKTFFNKILTNMSTNLDFIVKSVDTIIWSSSKKSISDVTILSLEPFAIAPLQDSLTKLWPPFAFYKKSSRPFSNWWRARSIEAYVNSMITAWIIGYRFLPNYRRTMSFVLEGQAKTHRHYQEIIDAHRLPDSAQGCLSFFFLFYRRKTNAAHMIMS